MRRQWGCDRGESEKAMRHFLDAYDSLEYCPIGKETIYQAFDLAHELDHDVFDAVYLSTAIRTGAMAILTMDTDLQRLCQRKRIRYLNPVPKHVLEKFAHWKTQKLA